MVTIGIDARFYGTENTGLGRYTKNVLLPLVKLLPSHKLVIFLRDPYYDSLKLGRGVEKVRCNLPHYSLAEQLILPRLIKQRNVDLWFSFHFNTPVFTRVPKVHVIHDLIKTYSTGRDTTTRAPWLYQLKRWGYNHVMRSAVTQSREIIVPTNTVKNDILAKYQERPEKIHPIWEAPDSSLQAISHKPQAKINLPNKFILYVGNAYPHKNLKTLLSAHKTLKNKHLIIVASNTPYLDKLVDSLSKKTKGRITILSSLTDQELGYLYKHADMLIAPSLMEGFGLPGLEALVIGTPVIASDIPVFREVYGKHAIYFDPNSAKDLVRAVGAGSSRPSPRPLSYPRQWKNVATDIAEVIRESCHSL